MRYKGQINEVEVACPTDRWDRLRSKGSWPTFTARYESLYGPGAGFREARVEIVTYRVRTSAVSPKPAPPASPRAGPDAAPRRARADPARVLGGDE